MMPIFCDIVRHTLSICGFQESLLSIVKPKNLVEDTISRTVPSNVIFVGSLSSELLKIIHLVFCRFNDSLFALIQESKFSSSETRILTRVWGSGCERKTFESSANNIKERISEEF